MKPILGFAWYRQEQWQQLLAVSSDRGDLEETFAEWLALAEKSIAGLRRQGGKVRKVEVNVDDLVCWCQAEQRPIDSKARAAFVVHKLSTGT
jgi:hypothetical protein